MIDDADLQGYAGLLCYHEWGKSQTESTQRRIYFSNAQKHLRRSLDLNPSSMFEYYYYDLCKEEKSRLEELEKNFKERPDDINVCR